MAVSSPRPAHGLCDTHHGHFGYVVWRMEALSEILEGVSFAHNIAEEVKLLIVFAGFE